MSSEEKKTFQIVQEKAATRCEICHQTDLFDLETGLCGRCQPLIESQLVPRLEWVEDVASPVLLAPANGQPFRVPNALTYHHPTISHRSVGRVAREALHLYRRNFRVFFSITAVMELPLALLVCLFFKIPAILPLVYLAGVLLTTLAAGALSSAVLDSFPGENVSVNRAYNFIKRRGARFVWASLSGQSHRWSGFAGGAMLGFFVGAFGSMIFASDWPLLILPFFGGLWLSGKTYVMGAFVTEIAALEGRTFNEALARSRWLTETNQPQLRSLNAAGWLARFGMAALVFSSKSKAFLLYLSAIFSLCLPGLLAQHAFLFFLLVTVLRVFLLPFWGTFKTLLYLFLRRQAEGAEFAFRYALEENN